MKVIVRMVEDRRVLVEKNIMPYIPNLEICLETAKEYHSNNAYWTFQRALEQAGDESCLHLEDDIILTSNFLEKVNKVISERPNQVIQFFSMRKADLEVGSRLESGRTFMCALCFYLPKGMSKEVKDYNAQWELDNESQMHGAPLDVALADYLKSKKLKYFINVPSLVEHLPIKSSIDKRRSSKRQSKTFIK